MTNVPEHDPDSQYLPCFAANNRFFSSLFSTYHEWLMFYDSVGRRLIRYQAFLYYPALMFGQFNLYVQSWISLIQGQDPRKGATITSSRWWET